MQNATEAFESDVVASTASVKCRQLLASSTVCALPGAPSRRTPKFSAGGPAAVFCAFAQKSTVYSPGETDVDRPAPMRASHTDGSALSRVTSARSDEVPHPGAADVV